MANEVSRRVLLRGAFLGAVAAGLAGCSQGSVQRIDVTASPSATASPPPSPSPRASGALELGPTGAPQVLLLHSWWGRGPAALDWARLLAEAGYHVVLPDLFGGRTARTVAEARALEATLGGQTAYAAAEQAAAVVASRGLPWAALGFSMGAAFAARLSGLGSDGPDVLHLFYGGAGPSGPVSRTRRAVLHVVPVDPYFSADQVAATSAGLTGAGVTVTTFSYDRARHWFAERGTPGFDSTAFSRARSRVLTDLGSLGG